jgi:sulfur carrier protein ThiS
MQIQDSLFTNRNAVLATMHQKEQVIAPILEQELGIKVIVPVDFNTDIFGTFSREIKRAGNQIEAARFKAEKALEITGEKIAIASEGSFAPHPHLPYISSNKEIVIFVDQELDLEIIGEEFSIETNHNHQVVENLESAFDFAKQVGFPQHALIVMLNENPKDSSEVFKGINTEEKLLEAINLTLKKSPTGRIHIETDMRAMYNPTRMKNIEKATQNLISKIKSCCPKCSQPGFEITQRIQGLPCAMCSAPTLLTKAVIYQCKKCGFKEERLFPDGIELADPAQCMYCNP